MYVLQKLLKASPINFVKLTKNQLSQILFKLKLETSNLHLFSGKKTLAQLFFWNFCETFNNIYGAHLDNCTACKWSVTFKKLHSFLWAPDKFGSALICLGYIRFEPQSMPMVYLCLGNVPFTYFNLRIHPINLLLNSSKRKLELFESFTKVLICVSIFYFDCYSFMNGCW